MLPPELILDILELLQQDKLTLMSCALVSKLWHNLAGCYLFASLTVEKHKLFFAFCWQNRQFAAHIQVLHLVQAFNRRTSYRSLVINSLKSALPLLSSLHTLSVSAPYGWNTIRTRPKVSATPESTNCQKASLKRLNVTPIHDAMMIDTLGALLSLFVVDSLRVVRPALLSVPVRYLPNIPGAPDLPKNQTQIGELVIHDQQERAGGCFQAIENILQPRSLQALAVDAGCGNRQVSLVSRLLTSPAAQNLTSFHIQFVIERTREASIANPLSRTLGNALAQCSQLACLRIALEALASDCLPLPFFFNVLNSPPRQPLRVLAVQLSPPSSDWWKFCSEILDMPILDELLPRPGGRFEQLRHFHLDVYKSKALPPWGPPPKSLDEYGPGEVLPRLRAAAGLLRFTVVHSYYNTHQDCEIFHPDGNFG